MSGTTAMGKVRVFMILAVLTCCGVATVSAAPDWYVKDNGGTTGCNSWANACSLQHVLANAQSGDEIWVAGGTYFPATSSADRTVTFEICGVANLKIYGGFDGVNDDELTDRAWASCDGGDYDGKPCWDTANDTDCPGGGDCIGNVTTLSGDLDSDDVLNAACTDDGDCTSGKCVGGACLEGDNAYHVVKCSNPSNTPLLDGFVVQSGVADGDGPETALDNQGAAIQIRNNVKHCYNDSTKTWITASECPSTPCNEEGGYACKYFVCSGGGIEVNNSLIRYNYSENHGAVNDHSATSSYTNCRFEHNNAHHGGGLLVDNGTVTIDGCLFKENEASSRVGSVLFADGAAAWFQSRDGQSEDCSATPTVTILDSTFVANTADRVGGAVFYSEDDVEVSTSLFQENAAAGGGGIWGNGGTLTVEDTDFEGNDAPGGGAGVFVLRGSCEENDEYIASGPGTTTIRDHCNFTNNTSHAGVGAAIYTFGKLTLQDSTVEANSAANGANAFCEGGNLNTYGGAVFAQEQFSIERTEFVRNSTDFVGAAVYAQYLGNDESYISDSTFYGNYGTGSVGPGNAYAVTLQASLYKVSFVNNVFVDNTVGGIHTRAGSGADIVNCSFVRNGIGLRTSNVTESLPVRVTNSVFWDNDLELVSDVLPPTIAYSDVQGGLPAGVIDGGGNISANPLFEDDPDPGADETWGTSDDNYGDLNLTSSSPCIDAGDSTMESSVIVSHPFYSLGTAPGRFARFVDDPNKANNTGRPNSCDGVVDMGATEYQVACSTSGDCYDECGCLNVGCESGSCTFQSKATDGTVCGDEFCGEDVTCSDGVCMHGPEGLDVSWLYSGGPGGLEPVCATTGDYLITPQVGQPPDVTLYSTKASGQYPVTDWNIGRNLGDGPEDAFDIGTVSTIWSSEPDPPIRVNVGHPTITARMVKNLTGSSVTGRAILNIVRDVTESVIAVPGANGGGFISGVIAGLANRIEATAVGDATTPGTLTTGALGEAMVFESFPSGSTLELGKRNEITTGDIIIKSGDVDGSMRFNGVFDGRICGPNLDPFPTANIDVEMFGPNAEICEVQTSPTVDCVNCVAACSGTPLSAPPIDTSDVCDGGANDGNSCSNDSECPNGKCGTKVRYISFDPSAADGNCAVRVELTTIGPDAGASVQGEAMWVGTPSGTPKFAELQCDPVYRDWSSDGLIHAYGREIAANSLYTVRLVCDSCPSVERDISTGVFGDVAEPHYGSVQPDFNDISEVVSCFLDSTPDVPRCDLQPEVPDHVIDFQDIAKAVEGYLAGDPDYYPFNLEGCSGN